MPPGSLEAMKKAEKESMRRLDAELEKAREAGVLDGCPHCDAAYDLLEPHMKPDEAHIETIARILAELKAANMSLGFSDPETALEKGYTSYVARSHRLETLLEESTDCVIMLRGDVKRAEAAATDMAQWLEESREIRNRLLDERDAAIGDLRDSEAKEAALQLEVERLEAFGCEPLSDEETPGRYDPTPEAEALIAAKLVADADAKYYQSIDAQFGCEHAHQELIAARKAYQEKLRD